MNFDRFQGRLPEDRYHHKETCACGEELGLGRNQERTEVIFQCPVCDEDMCEKCQTVLDCDHGPVCPKCVKRFDGLDLCAKCYGSDTQIKEAA